MRLSDAHDAAIIFGISTNCEASRVRPKLLTLPDCWGDGLRPKGAVLCQSRATPGKRIIGENLAPTGRP